MKSIVFVSIFLAVVSCDPVSYSTFVVSNETDLQVSVTSYLADSTDSYAIGSFEKHTIVQNLRGFGSDTPAQLTFDGIDSVYMVFPKEQIIRFYPDSSNLSSGKNIYNNDDWDTSSDKNDYEVTFGVTEEDLSNIID